MGNSIIGITCQKPTIMSVDDDFASNKTLKVSGVSKLLQDQLTKEFQRKGNSTRFHEDVNKLYVCPKGEDYVLVEFVKDLPSDPTAIGKILTIGGTKLNVEKSIAPNDYPKSVTRIIGAPCQKPKIMSVDDFASNKTLKVSGVSKLLQDQLTKEFQRKGNSTRFHDDVNKLYICPKGEDYVLVEFVKNLPSDPTAIGKILTIGGTKLNVEKSIAPNDDSKLVTRIWSAEDEEEGQSTKTKTDKKLFGKDARQEKFNDHRPGIHSDKNRALFGKAEVRLKKKFVTKIEKDAECGKILKKENVKLQDGKMTGTWNGIFVVGQWLYSHFSSLDLTHFGYDEDEDEDEESISSSRSSIDQSEGSLIATNQSAQSKKPDESFCVSSLFLRYIIAYHYAEYQKLENVSKEISFEVAESKTDRKLNLFARRDVKEATFAKTVNDFIDFYQTQNQKMLQEIMPVPPKSKKVRTAEIQTKFSVVVDISQGSDKMTIYGERDNVQEAVQFLKGKAGELSSATSGPSKPKGDGSSSKVTAGSSSGHEKNATVEKFSSVIFQRVKISVYQGDISKETADVIVNPANEHLKHSAGAAKAIVEAGGKSIQDESDEIMKKRFYLKPGEVVVTKAGNLPCKVIVHAIGPRWANYSYYQKDTAKNVLYGAVLNSLTTASQNGATSISVPAISSGIFGVPLPICAEVLFVAATHFAQNAPSSNTLKDIRFVNIDKKTTQAFAQEMQKRYGASVLRENIEVFHFNVKGNEKIDQYSQNQFDAWQQTSMGTSKGTGDGVAGPKTPNVSYEGSHETHPGNKDNKSGLNPSAPAFTSKPVSYSKAVTGNPKDKSFFC